MKRGEFITLCADCIFHVGGECAEGRGQTNDKDGCIEIYNYDETVSELEKKPILPKMFLKHSPYFIYISGETICTASCRERQKHILFRNLCVELTERLQEMQSDTRTLTPDILMAAGYTKRHENEAVANFEKCFDEVWLEINWRKRINKIDVQCDGVIKTRLDVVTVGEFNTLLDIVKLEKFKI